MSAKDICTQKAAVLEQVMALMPEIRAALAGAGDTDLLDKVGMLEACYADINAERTTRRPPQPRSQLARNGLAPDVRERVEGLALSPDQLVAQRAAAILALADGASISRLADKMKIGRSTLEGIRRRFESDGVASLLRRRGRAPKAGVPGYDEGMLEVLADIKVVQRPK